ncbi:MAG: hypothetical protein U9R48_07300 [Chloroflexota bacterium]|nr:hypothetical protein [Chloroflexota bacterium]
MRLSIVGENFYQNGAATYTEGAGFPGADRRLAGLLLNHRVINGIFDDLNEDRDYDGDGRDDWAYADTDEWDPERNTQQFVDAMPDWRACGVIGFTVGLQGGNPFPTSPPPEGLSTRDLDCGAFNPDGSLRPAFLQRLRRILHEAERLDMVPIVNYFYQGGNRRIREEAIGTAIDNATGWLLEQGYDRLIIDLANECDASAYWPALQLPNIHEMIYRVKDLVALHNNAKGHERTFYVGASFTGTFSTAENLRHIPASFMRAIDLLLPHGNRRSTEEIAGAIDVLRERTEALARKPLPIVYNEDTQSVDEDEGDTGGDLEHLRVCLDAHVSWGNLIRSHQQVPCESWFEGTPVQRHWFETTRELAGEPEPPRSVHTFYHRI